MALSDIVKLTITQDSVGLARAGFGVPLILSATATFIPRVQYYSTLPSVAGDFAIDSAEYLSAQAMLSQSPKPALIGIGRCALPPTLAYALSVANVFPGNVYNIDVVGKGVTPTTAAITTGAANLAVVTVDDVGHTLTFGAPHGLTTGAGPFTISNSGGALPTGLSATTPYWIVVSTSTAVQLATSFANAVAGSPTVVAFSSNGSGTQTLNTVTNDQIVTGMVAALNAVPGKNYTAATAGSTGSLTMTVTATSAGAWFALAVDINEFGSLMTHADPGVATDLNAIVNSDNGWYAIHTLYNSSAYCRAVAGWVEANSKLYVFDVPETAALLTTVGNGDTIDHIHTSDYARTAACYHHIPNQFFAAAWMGRVLPIDPGSENWMFKELAGVDATPYTPTERINLRARMGNGYESNVQGSSSTFQGTTGSGNFLDVARGLDWVYDNMVKGVYEVLLGADKVPFTDAGVNMIEAPIRAVLKQAIARSIFVNGSDSVTAPLVSTVSTADKAARRFPGIAWSAELAGSINEVDAEGVVTV